MARLTTLTSGVALAVGLVIALAPSAVASPVPITPTTIDAHAANDHVDVIGSDSRTRLGVRSTRARTAAANRTLTSYRAVCGDTADLNKPSQCLSPLCPQAGHGDPAVSPFWVMNASSTPPPQADDWTNTGRFVCLASSEAAPKVTVSAEQFRRLPVPAPAILTQPQNRFTLINIGTNILTRKNAVILPTTVLGQAVRVRATPASYAWQYGDGGYLTTSDPGDLYPNMPTAHIYTVPGIYTVNLTTTFTGEFSVGGGPWQPITGTATVPSPSTTITAEERRAVLIS